MKIVDQDRMPNWITRLVEIGRRAGEAEISQSAAGLAYYTLFSLFPLLTVLIAVSSTFFGSKQIVWELTPMIKRFLPVSNDFIDQNFTRLVDLSSTVGIVSIITLVWSASNMFTVLNRNINKGWEGSQERGYFEKRIVAFAIIALLVLMLFIYILATNALQLLMTLNQLPIQGVTFFTSLVWDILNPLIIWLLVVSLLFIIYYWIPNTDVPKRAALISSVLISIVLWALSKGFSWFVSSGLANYEVIYGSLSTLVIFLLFIYLSNLILLFGNHLAAGISNSQKG